MNLPTERLYSLGRHKIFKCWKCSSSDPELIGFIIFIALFWSSMRGLHTKLFYNIKCEDFFLSGRRFVVLTAGSFCE